MSKYNILKDIATIDIRKHGCTKDKLKSIEDDLLDAQMKIKWAECELCKKSYEIDKASYDDLVTKRETVINEFINKAKELARFEYDEADLLFD